MVVLCILVYKVDFKSLFSVNFERGFRVYFGIRCVWLEREFFS